jgi:lipopolysaccharide transport system permease protein
MLVVYTFVFSVVFGVRWPGAQTDSKLSFAIVLFAGMIVYSVFAECVQRGPGLIISQPNFVKKVVFPLEVMPRGHVDGFRVVPAHAARLR